MARKLGHRGVVAAVRPGRLFFVTDSTSQRRYLVDNGSAFSIMPWQSSDPPSGPSLAGADGRRIPCWGERLFTITIGGVPRQWRFLLAAVSFPILGVDFLRHHSLVVDVANLRLSLPPPPVSIVTPGRSYADAVRSPPGKPPPAQAGAHIPTGGPSPPSPSSAAAADFGDWPVGQFGTPLSTGGISSPPPGSPPPQAIGWRDFSASFHRCFFRMPPPLPLPPPMACSSSSRLRANQRPPNSGG